MSLQLRAIAIYSHDGQVRAVKFNLGDLNIVTGASKTGKSALLDIVDYCWGRGECTVAEGEIRKKSSWFALLFDNAGEAFFLLDGILAPRVVRVMTFISCAVSKMFHRRQLNSRRT